MAVGNPDKWDEELIDLSGINSDLLPNIRPSFYKIGTLRSEIARNGPETRSFCCHR